MTYVLVYFPIRGKAEAIRLLLKDNNLEFREELMSLDMKIWTKEKEKFPFGQVPALWDGDTMLVQSMSILRHLARKHGLYGQSEEEMTLADMIADGFLDLREGCVTILMPDKPDEEKASFVAGLPSKLKCFEAFLGKTSSNHFFVGNKRTYTDYYAFVVLDMVKAMRPWCLEDFPKLNEFYTSFAEQPRIKEYLNDPLFKDRKHTPWGP